MRANSLFEFLKERAVIEEHEAMEIPDCLQIPDEPASTGSSITAPKSKKPKAHVTSTKPRNKQHQQRKFVPLKVTENTNRTNEVTAILTDNKLEINVPKRKLQNMEAVKRHNRKWKSINAQHKQSAARGTQITNIPQQRFDGDSD
jgi:argonaute-like protein implicated in RNA metabolism and viral defense